METPKFVDKTFVINMSKDADRLADFDYMMRHKLKWNYSRFEAINGKVLWINDKPHDMKLETYHTIQQHQQLKYKYTNFITWLSPSEIGCFLSHISLWEEVANNPELNRIAIFEDDARTYLSGKKIKRKIEKLYKQEDPDMLYLGKALDDCKNYTHILDNVYRSKAPFCLHAYIITKKGAQTLLSQAPFWDAIDIVPIVAAQKGAIDIMVFHPSLFYQNVINNNSNLRQFDNALNNLCECWVTNAPVNDSWLLIWTVIALIAAIILSIWFFNLFLK